jgi:16S rRNA (adenine1518-N6/adenine1519-N6)-dimethyltransferase
MKSGVTGGLRLKRSLGQHFLWDENIARKIAGVIAPQPDDVLLEIGPGQGALTRYLAGQVRHLIAVELDDRVVGGLRERFGAAGVEVVHGDILATDLEALAARFGRRLRVAGNIPYNITSPILFHVLDHRAVVSDLTIMMQREVARRLVAEPGGKEYGIPAVFSRLFADIELLFDVSPQSFVPVPAVTSSVIRMTMLPHPRFATADEGFFRAMVRAVFGHRRKTLRNTLKTFLGTPGIPAGLPVDAGRRPEELTVGELVELSNVLYTKTHGILPVSR